jgi:signal transduction histidine kinase
MSAVRRTIRLRLTLLYSSLFVLSAGGVLLLTYLLVANRTPVLVRGGAPVDETSAAVRELVADQQAETLTQLLIQSGVALAIMTVASLGLGWLVAGRVLRPLRTITATTRRISSRNLHERLAMAGPDDELTELGATVDGLLTRLEAAFTAQRQFVANASHELRTPLARQRTVLEVALGDPNPTVATLQTACQRVLATGEQQERIIEALLTLARSERGLDRREPLDLRAVTAEVMATRHADARSRDLRVHTELGPATVLGDTRLAERMVANLVDNALRHNTPGGRMDVTTRTRDGQATLMVTNTGPVIPPAELDRLFQPFATRDGERTTARLGLGLPIVTAIATAHDATLDAHPRPTGGLMIEIRFPRPG